LRRRPGGSTTVGTTSPRREPFIPQDQTPAGHTSAGLLTGFAALVVSKAGWEAGAPARVHVH
jgi:hypothetical protein